MKEIFLLEGVAGGVEGGVVKEQKNPSLLSLKNMKSQINLLVNLFREESFGSIWPIIRSHLPTFAYIQSDC